MKTIVINKIHKAYKIRLILVVAIMFALYGCPKADEEFVHESNTISSIICRGKVLGTEVEGIIHEFDKNGVEITGVFTQEEVEGGSGLIIFSVPAIWNDEIDLTSVMLMARLTWDQIITPSLMGRHDITGEGIIISVKSGAGTIRQYRIRGEYN